MVWVLSFAYTDDEFYLEEENGIRGIIDTFTSFYNEYRVIFGGLVVLIGLIQCFLGLRAVKTIMFFCGVAIGFIPSLYTANSLLEDKLDTILARWVGVLVSVLIGVFVGILFLFLYQLGYCVLGGASGAVYGTYGVVAIDVWLKIHYHSMLWVALILFSAVNGAFALIWEKTMCILSTSVVGSYMIAVGLSQFVGNWLDPFAYDFYMNLLNPPWEWIMYFGVVVLFSLLGILVQSITNRDPSSKALSDLDEFEQGLLSSHITPTGTRSEDGERARSRSSSSSRSTSSSVSRPAPIRGGKKSRYPGTSTGHPTSAHKPARK